MNSIEHTKSGATVEISQLSKIYQTREGDEVVALGNIDLKVDAGSFVAVVGPSGCGKSTLLSMLAGLTPASPGQISINVEKISKPHRKTGVVFQSDLLLYWRTILDNILLPIEIKKLDVDACRSRAEALLKQVGLDGFGNKNPSELSGGSAQRVAICRAIIQDPGLLLMDEPFGALDALTREQMIMDLQALWLRIQNTVLFITHGIDEAVVLRDPLLDISPRPGRVDLDLKIQIPRPRQWRLAHAGKEVHGHVRQIREIFEPQGVLVVP